MSEPTFGQAKQILNIVQDKKLDRERIEALIRSGFLSDLLDADVSRIDRTVFRAALTSKAKINSIIRVDRSVIPDYPKGGVDVLYPGLERSGPAEFDLSKVELWLHEGQKNGGRVIGDHIYEHLQSNDMLDSCLSLADGLAIQAKGIAVFREYFKRNAVFLWKSVVRKRDGDLNVPYLFPCDRDIGLGWHWLGNRWYYRDPALRFPSQN